MTPDEIDSLRDAALAVVKDPRCRDLIAATAQGESEARSAYEQAKALAPPMHEWGTRFAREAHLAAMTARVALGIDDGRRVREIVASLGGKVSA